jgi:hypothetical protein
MTEQVKFAKVNLEVKITNSEQQQDTVNFEASHIVEQVTIR